MWSWRAWPALPTAWRQPGRDTPFLAPHPGESVQFVSGLAVNANGDFVLSYGVNDCEARVGVVGRERVWRSFQPMPVAGEFAKCRGAST
jgi:hypothetical protein